MTVQPVPFLSLLGMALTLIVSVGLPVALFIYTRKKYEVKTSSIIFGAIVYYVAAKVFEPFINASIISNLGGAVMNNVYIYSIYVALIAVVVEEGLRYLSLKTVIKNCDEHNALYFGIGFCGLEAILIAAWPQLGNILNSVLINNGMMAQSLALLQEPDLTLTYNAIAPLWEIASLSFLLAGLERALIILLHLCICLLLFYYIKTGNKKQLGAAILGHFAVVACSALFGMLDMASLSVLSTALISAALAVFTQRSHKEYLACMPMSEYAVVEFSKPLE